MSFGGMGTFAEEGSGLFPVGRQVLGISAVDGRGSGLGPGRRSGGPSGSIAALRPPLSITPQQPLFPGNREEPLQRPQEHRPPLPADTERAWERRRRSREGPGGTAGLNCRENPEPTHAAGLSPLPRRGLRLLPCRAPGILMPASPPCPSCQNHPGRSTAPLHHPDPPSPDRRTGKRRKARH